ncbi:hypothetical protein SAMN05192568_107519 [Methylobacterium pseudosasicola]|uniref:Uncharacterized protein n=1 Tax=Methylobacterium pseudosasicola TaxID=582667 RepID=A0A1I4URZ5_9HYPH|nr:hypothetical protein SAMN05192568_107519 [Methylobacterium pseudosasicola]
MAALPRDMPSELADVIGIYIHCEDCGRKSYWPGYKVRAAEQKGFRTVQTLGSRFRCHVCEAQGGGGRNVSLRLVERGQV